MYKKIPFLRIQFNEFLQMSPLPPLSYTIFPLPIFMPHLTQPHPIVDLGSH